MSEGTLATTLEKFESNAVWTYYIPVPKEFGDQYIIDDKKRRVICCFENQFEAQVALMPKGDEYFININKEVRTKLGIKEGDKVHISLKKDESKYGLPIPEEFEELLHQDEMGNKLFHALTPGKQRNLIYIAGKPKSSDIRLKKSLVIVNYLKSTNGKLDFKELNEAFKQA